MTGQFDFHMEFGRLQGRMDGIENRTTSLEKTMVGMDGKLDTIQSMIAERTGFIRGGARVVAAVVTVLSLAAAWFSGLIHHG